jgi:hypothetical protein
MDSMIAVPHLALNRLCEAEMKNPARSGADLAKLVNGSGFANGRALSPCGKRGGEECRHTPVLLRRGSRQLLLAPEMLSSSWNLQVGTGNGYRTNATLHFLQTAVPQCEAARYQY